MECKNKEKLKKQNSSRIRTQEWTNSYQREREVGRMSGKGGIRVGKKKGKNITIYNVGGAQGGMCNTEKTSSDSTASYYADGQ